MVYVLFDIFCMHETKLMTLGSTQWMSSEFLGAAPITLRTLSEGTLYL